MPSAILLDPPAAAPSDNEPDSEDAASVNAVLSAYLTPLLSKHARGLPLVYEDLVQSYAAATAAITGADSADNMELESKLANLHMSQLAAYETAARSALAESAQDISRAYPHVEDGEGMDSYLSRIVAHIKTHHFNLYAGWKVDEQVLEEAFWAPIQEGARRSYLEHKGQSEKSEEGKVGTVRDFEAAALGALVSKSEVTSEASGQEGTMSDVGDEAGDNNEEEVEDQDGVVLVAEERDEGKDTDEDMPAEQPVMTPVPIHGKKRRRLPNGPLGGDSAQPQSAAAAKKQKTAGKGLGSAAGGGGAGRGGTSANGPGGRGGKGGRGGRGRRNRKKGAGGAGAGGGNVA